MKDSYFSRQLFLAIQQFAAAAFLCTMAVRGNIITEEHYIHFLIVSLFFIDAAYVSYKNIQNNRILNHFIFVLLLSGWQFLFSLYDSYVFPGAVSKLLLPLNLYQSVYFLQLFVFQAAAYKYQKGLLAVIRITCTVSAVCFFISQQAFALTYLVQLLFSAAAILFAGFFHRNRILFVLKSQRKELMLSFCVIVLPFIIYTAAFYRQIGYLDNMGSYFVLMLAFFSIHSIVFQSRPQQEYFFALTRRNALYVILLGTGCLALAAYLLQTPFIEVLVFIHCAVLFAMLFNLFLYMQIRKRPDNCSSYAGHGSFYAYSLAQLKREEDLRRDFSNYLHDNVLQDLLSMKNLMSKAEQPEVHKLILDTFDNLNSSIRRQMQTYHPVLLKNLTLKENIRNLLDAFTGNQASDIHLDCDDMLFLVEPYDVIVCRMIQELVANALKHSVASDIHVAVVQSCSCISLTVADNGIGFEPSSCHQPGHRGLDSIKEQVNLLEGTIVIHSSHGSGTHIKITMPMKGEGSYETFVTR